MARDVPVSHLDGAVRPDVSLAVVEADFVVAETHGTPRPIAVDVRVELRESLHPTLPRRLAHVSHVSARDSRREGTVRFPRETEYNESVDNAKAAARILNAPVRDAADLCALVELIGYKRRDSQLRCANGAFASSLLAFLDDNPAAVEAVQEFIAARVSAYELLEGPTEDDEGDLRAGGEDDA